MPAKKEIDNASLIQMVKDDMHQSEIMAKLGLKTSTQLKVAYANALMETGTVAVLKAGRSRKVKPVDTLVTLNKRGSLVISKNLTEHFGFNPGDAFDLRKSREALSLKLRENRLSFPKSSKK